MLLCQGILPDTSTYTTARADFAKVVGGLEQRITFFMDLTALVADFPLEEVCVGEKLPLLIQRHGLLKNIVKGFSVALAPGTVITLNDFLAKYNTEGVGATEYAARLAGAQADFAVIAKVIIGGEDVLEPDIVDESNPVHF